MRKTSFLFFICFGISTLFSSCSSDSEDNPTLDLPLMEETRLDIAYGSHSEQVYDLYLPANRSSIKTKVIVLIHGGGWTGGDKSDMDELVSIIQQNHPNHAIVNLNYVLSNVTTPAFPNQFLDVDSVINKITSEKEELQILPEFGMIGASAGAHISLMYDAIYDTNDQVKFVGDIVGPTDFTDPFYANNPGFAILFGLLVDENAYPNAAVLPEATSPVYQVSSSSSPTLMFYGDTDPLVPLSNGQLLAEKLSDAQVTNSLTVYAGGHGNWDSASIINMHLQLSNYIEEYLDIP